MFISFSQGGGSNLKWIKQICTTLPQSIEKIITNLPDDKLHSLEEIRIRLGKPVILNFGQFDAVTDYIVTNDDVIKTTQLISNCSLYALEEELKNGFITITGGHRVGITGKVVVEKGKVKTMKYLTAFNIRISKEFIGSADKIVPYIISVPDKVKHTLIISPPCCGKTTLLRDIVRQISNGIPWLTFKGLTVGVVDERSEIAGCYQGVPQLDVGVRTDVLDGCPKAEGMLMLIRAMGPKVLATDEIGKMEDIEALQEVINAGVKVIATIHGENLTDLMKRPAFKFLLEQKIFEVFIILGKSRGVGTIEGIIDGITQKPVLAYRKAQTTGTT